MASELSPLKFWAALFKHKFVLRLCETHVCQVLIMVVNNINMTNQEMFFSCYIFKYFVLRFALFVV